MISLIHFLVFEIYSHLSKDVYLSLFLDVEYFVNPRFILSYTFLKRHPYIGKIKGSCDNSGENMALLRYCEQLINFSMAIAGMEGEVFSSFFYFPFMYKRTPVNCNVYKLFSFTIKFLKKYPQEAF